MPPDRAPDRGQGFLWAAPVMILGLLLRLRWFIGWGLGDDSYYAWMANRLAHGDSLDFAFGSDYRLGLHLPNALSFRLFGANDVSFVLFPFLCSLGTLLVAYLLGRRIAGTRVGLIGTVLLAFSPFDAVYASTMTIDVVVGFLSAVAVLLFLQAEEAGGGRGRIGFILSAAAVSFAYMVKIPALAIVGVLALYSAAVPRGLVRHATFYATFAALWTGLCLADYLKTGGFLNYWALERAYGPRFSPALGLGWYFSYYPRAMFRSAIPFASLSFGFTFYAAVPALVYVFFARLRTCLVLVLWSVGLFLLLQFLPSKVGLPYEPLPRFTRYLEALMVPSLLLVAVALEAVARRSRILAGAMLTLLLAGSVDSANRIAEAYRDSLRDERVAAAFLAPIPLGKVYSDNRLLNRLNFERRYLGAERLVWMQTDLEKRRTPALLAYLGPGHVVTGGARGPDMASTAVFELGVLPPPPHWRLLREIPGEPKPWRREPLRIFYADRR